MRIKIIIISTLLVIAAAVGIYFVTIPTIYATLNSVATLSGHRPLPQQFLAFCDTSEAVTVTILSPHDSVWHQNGRFDVTLELTYGRRTVIKNTTAHILLPVDYKKVEVGTPVDTIAPRAFLHGSDAVANGVLFETQMITPLAGLTDTTGRHQVEVYLNGTTFLSTLYIVDTTPPAATVTYVTIPMGADISPTDFILEYFDASPPVDIAFAGEIPDVFLPGQHTVDIALADRYHNTATYSAILTVEPNTIPPRIVGAQDIQLVLDSPAMFRRGVSAYDAFGRPLDFTVDVSDVDVDTLGEYQITYHAVDCCGNSTSVTVQVFVVDVDPEDVRERAAAVLDRILREDMTQVQQAQAIFNWITANVGYAAGFEHRTVYESANQALVHRRGDCFVFYSISELLLTMAGIPNMRIDRLLDPQRPGEQSRHVWNLINPDELGWHHFDTTPLIVRQIDRFMFTQTQAEQFTRIIHAEGQGRDYFTFDPDLYPEVVR